MKKKNIIYALGFFDGVHLGHQALLSACRHLADRNGCTAGVVTFSSHPDTLVSDQAPMLINTIEDRQRLFLSYGISNILVLPFDQQLMRMPWVDFLEDLLEKGAAGFVCGDDFRFGFRGEGNARLLADFCQDRGLSWAVVPAQSLDAVTVSSTYIRKLLEEGEMAQAVAFLGHPHILTGKVISGRKLGRTLGIPTANLAIPEGVICPRRGVYACKAVIDGAEYMAVTNIGIRPTVGGHHTTVEAWLLDFEGDLYGKVLPLAFHAFLRPEQKFPSLEDLQAQIQKDAAAVRRLFLRNG